MFCFDVNDKKKGILKRVIRIISFCFLIASLCMISLPGIVGEAFKQGIKVTMKVPFYGLIFGSFTMTNSYYSSGSDLIVHYDFIKSEEHICKGGISTGALYAFIMIVLAIIGTVVFYFIDKKHDRSNHLIVALCILSSVAFIFITLVTGSDVIAETGEVYKFNDFFKGCRIGVGVILSGIFSSISSILMAISAIMDPLYVDQ